MWQSYENTRERRWVMLCREEFDLTPLELATLVAIVTFHNCNDGAAVHLEQLRAFDHEYEGDDPIDVHSAPSVLYRKGLIMRMGPPQDRSFAPTLRGMRRVAS